MRLGERLPWLVEGKAERPGQAEHDPAVPGIGIVPERLAEEAASGNAARGIRDEQLGMRELVNPEATAGPARGLRIVEHEEGGTDIAVDEPVRRGRDAAIKPL